jgi:hypothetical protein
LLHSVRTATAGLHDFLSTVANPHLYGERKQTTAAVFSSLPTEVLVNILSHLSIRDLLVAQQVDHTFNSTITASPELQESLSLRSTSGNFSMPLGAHMIPFIRYFGIEQQFPGFYGAFQPRDLHLHRFHHSSVGFLMNQQGQATIHPIQPTDTFPIYVTETFQTDVRGSLPRLGERCRHMLVCQPPINEMTVSFSCCAPHVEPEPISCASGLTVGHLYDKAEQLFDGHGLCPETASHVVTAKGCNPLVVSFRTEVNLSNDDPWAVRFRAAEDAAKMKKNARNRQGELLQQYKEAQKAGMSTRHPIRGNKH